MFREPILRTPTTRFLNFILMCFIIIICAATGIIFVGFTAERAECQKPTKPEGELIVVMSTFRHQALDPVLDTNASKWRLIPLYDCLIGLENESELSPKTGVATKWEYSPDYRRLTIWLRKGIKFHNGDDLAAADVKFSLERTVSPYSMDEYKEYIQNIKEIRILDPYKLELLLEKPAPKLAYFLTTLQGMSAFILPKEYFEKHGDKYFALHPIGSGPYKFHSQVVDSFIKLEAVDYKHWRVGTPKYKYITCKIVPEESTRVAMLKRGEADIIEIGRDKAAELERTGFKVERKKGGRILGYQFLDMWRKDTPFGNKKVRQAMALAVNKDEVIQYILLGGGKKTGIWPAGSYCIGYSKANALCPPYPYDPEKAKALLAEAGYSNGFKMDFYSFAYSGLPEAERLVQAMASYFENIGIKVNIIPMDYGKVREKIYSHEMPTSLHYSALANRLLGEDVPTQWYSSKGLSQNVRDPSMDAKLEACMEALSMNAYEKSVVDLLSYIHSEYVNIPICELDELFGVSNKIPKGWEMGTSAFGLNLEYLYKQ